VVAEFPAGMNDWTYNFGKGGQALSRHAQGMKQMAVSVRCVRE